MVVMHEEVVSNLLLDLHLNDCYFSGPVKLISNFQCVAASFLDEPGTLDGYRSGANTIVGFGKEATA